MAERMAGPVLMAARKTVEMQGISRFHRAPTRQAMPSAGRDGAIGPFDRGYERAFRFLAIKQWASMNDHRRDRLQ